MISTAREKKNADLDCSYQKYIFQKTRKMTGCLNAAGAEYGWTHFNHRKEGETSVFASRGQL